MSVRSRTVLIRCGYFFFLSLFSQGLFARDVMCVQLSAYECWIRVAFIQG